MFEGTLEFSIHTWVKHDYLGHAFLCRWKSTRVIVEIVGVLMYKRFAKMWCGFSSIFLVVKNMQFVKLSVLRKA